MEIKEVVAKMNEHKELFFSTYLEQAENVQKIKVLREKRLFGPTRKEQEQIKALNDRNAFLDDEAIRIANEAYELMSSHMRYSLPKKEWKRYLFKLDRYAYEIELNMRKGNRAEVKKLYDSIDSTLAGKGFQIKDYDEPDDSYDIFTSDYSNRESVSYSGVNSSSSIESGDSPHFEAYYAASQINDVRIYEGRSQLGSPAFTLRKGKLYEGRSSLSEPLFTIEKNKIYRGRSTLDEPAYTVKRDKIYTGSSTLDEPVFTLDRDYVYKGYSTIDSPLYSIKMG